MRDPDRIPILLEKIRKVWLQYPDLRLVQLIQGVSKRPGFNERDTFYMEDDVFSQYLDSWISK